MDNKFERSLLGSGDLMRRAGLTLLNNAGRAIALITLAVAALVTFTDLSFRGFMAENFTEMMLIMLASSYLIYFSMEDTGEKAGEGIEEYKSALAEYNAVAERISGEAIPTLRDFCKEYSLSELNFRRENLLLGYGESLEGYHAYISGEVKFDRKRRRIFKRARRLRSVELSPKILLTHEHTHTKSELTSPDTYKIFRLILKLLPTTVCMFLTVSIIPTVKELTPSLVIEGILKLSSLPVIAFRGYSAGFFHIRRRVIPWIETKTRLLGAFIKGEDARQHAKDGASDGEPTRPGEEN